MKRYSTFALATVFALSGSVAFAQMGGNDSGATVPERSGTALDSYGVAVGTVHRGRTITPRAGTTGMSRTEPSGPGAEPGERDKSRVGGQGVHSRQ